MANYEIGTSYQNKQNRAKAMALLEILHEKEKHLFHVEVIDTEHKNAVMAFYSVKENKNKNMTLKRDVIDHEVVEVEECGLTRNKIDIDLPLLIEQVNQSFIYYNEELAANRYTHKDYWCVSPAITTPAKFKLAIREFKPIAAALMYAIREYRKFLRSELNRVKDF